MCSGKSEIIPVFLNSMIVTFLLLNIDFELLSNLYLKTDPVIILITFKSYCSTMHFCRITSVYQLTDAHIISHKTLLKHFKTLRHVLILSDQHQRALFLAKVILRYSQFNSYLHMRYCGSISCCVGMCCGAVARCASYDTHLATAPQHNMICCHNTSFANTN